MVSGRWTLTYDKDGVSIFYDDKPLAQNVSAEFDYAGNIVNTRQYQTHRIASSTVKDAFGKGQQWVVSHKASDKPELLQTFRVYDRYVLTDISIASDKEIKTNYMAPIVVEKTAPLLYSTGRRTLFVPFDNDAWVRYKSTTTTGDHFRSYEVTCVYDADSRKGVVIGAIEHDRWKNAIDFTHNSHTLKAFSGVADKLTRDTNKHGFVCGKEVKSATMMIGVFDDWRKGMETYAETNSMVAKPRKWTKAMPVGWNSWGALQFKVNPTNSTEVADYFASKLQPRSFHNSDGLAYIGLDSGWDSFTEEQLENFAEHCRQQNQVPCIYWTPFTDWGKDPERAVHRAEQYKYKDIYLYADGKPQELDGAYAVDPTHPAVRQAMEKTAALFRRCGFKYVKMDFMTHGRMEADKWYRPDVTTGTEAYNYGMQLLDSIFHDMYLNLSISPIFPSQYAQSRRIACDAWNKIKDTEYTMNALSYGWWIDRVYDYNDADHIVLRDATEGENRARITSSAITGLYIAGDDFSASGDSLAKERAMKYLTNAAVNKIATGRSFRPLNGDDDNSESLFIRHEANGDIYLAVFNYTEKERSMTLPLSRMGTDNTSTYRITELWSGKKVIETGSMTIPPKDAMIFLFEKR